LLFTLLVYIGAKTLSNPLRYIPYVGLGVFVTVLGFRLVKIAMGIEVDDFMQSHFRFDSLFLDVFCHWLWRYHGDLVARHINIFWLIGVALLIIPSIFFSRNDELMFSIGFSLLAIAYATLLLYALVHGFGWFGSGPLGAIIAAVGVWSYNIYLWHI
jgi:peptidoglycan/LPS O-acetylase OafA/YrhL